MELSPRFIQKNGKNEFVILPCEEFSRIRELIEDYEDLTDLRKAKAACGNEPSVPLDKVIKDLGAVMPVICVMGMMFRRSPSCSS